MNRSFLITLTCFSVLISGCSIKQRVTSIDSQITEIVIVENPKVAKAGFLSTYKKALEDKGCIVRIEPSGVNLKDYEFSSTYTANWAWDLSLYMRYAQIRVYHNGIKCGRRHMIQAMEVRI